MGTDTATPKGHSNGTGWAPTNRSSTGCEMLAASNASRGSCRDTVHLNAPHTNSVATIEKSRLWVIRGVAAYSNTQTAK